MKKFGETSLILNGSSDYLEVENSDWDISQEGNWTIDMWIKNPEWSHVALVKVDDSYAMYINGSGTMVDVEPKNYINKYWYNYITGEVVYIHTFKKQYNMFYVNSNRLGNTRSVWHIFGQFEEVSELKAKLLW